MKRSHYFNQHLYLAERMASFFTRKFSGLNITYDDLYQEALQGLLEASKIYELLLALFRILLLKGES